MKNFINFMILTLISFSIAEAAELTDHNFNLKTGLSFNRSSLKTSLLPDSPKKEDETSNSGIGFYTSFGHKWSKWEILASSDVVFGNLSDLSFAIDSYQIRGSGHYRIFSLSPMIKYFTNYVYKNRWNLYSSFGPTLSLHTFIVNRTDKNSTFNSSKRISFENKGLSLNVGFEEVVAYKSIHSTFFEIGYSYMRSNQVFIVDASDFKDVKTLSNSASKDFSGRYVFLRLGFTLF